MTVDAGWERHLQSWLLGLLTLAVMGFGASTISAARDIAVIRAEVTNMQQQMVDRMGDRYTGTEHAAYREFDKLRADNMLLMIQQNRVRLKELEQRSNGND